MERIEFKFNIKNINEVCKEIKERVNHRIAYADYTELAIMYSTINNNFFVAPTFDIEELVYQGHICYKIYTHYSINGKTTIKELKLKIF